MLRGPFLRYSLFDTRHSDGAGCNTPSPKRERGVCAAEGQSVTQTNGKAGDAKETLGRS